MDSAGTGNWETSYASDTLVVDVTEPNTTLTAYTPDPSNDNTLTYSGQATDTTTNIAAIQYRVDGVSWVNVTGFTSGKNVSFTFTTSALSDGSHTIETRAKDNAGNWETTYPSDTLVVDVTEPNTTLTAYTPDPSSDNTPTRD
ncbi:MAG: Ig-like domain-containing protein [bacterium]|nr:Ig-like domain-containing protein [bacterium]